MPINKTTAISNSNIALIKYWGNRDDDLIEQPHATPDQILVAAGDRVERAGIHGADFHGGCASFGDFIGIVASSNRKSP